MRGRNRTIKVKEEEVLNVEEAQQGTKEMIGKKGTRKVEKEEGMKKGEQEERGK